MAERGSKKVLLNASPWGTLDTLYPKTTVDLIHTKDASVPVFPEILPENTSEYLVMTSAGTFVFTDRVGKVDDVLVISSEIGEQGVSVVDDKTAKIRFAPGLIVNSDGSIRVDRDVFATNDDLNAFHDEFIMVTSELDDKLDSEIARSTKRDSELDDKVNRLNSEMLDRVNRLNSEMLDRVNEMNSEIHHTIDNMNSEINDRITELDDRLTSELAAEIERATNSEAYIINWVDDIFLKKYDSENILETSEHDVLLAINEVNSKALDLADSRQNKLRPDNAGDGVIITVDSQGQLDKINLKVNTSENTIVIDSNGIRGNYQAGTALEIENHNTFNVLYDNVTIKVSSEGELYWAKTITDLLPPMDGKVGKALVVDSQGGLTWDDAGKIDIVAVSGSESIVSTIDKVATITQIDASIIKGSVDKATSDSAGNVITNTYQRIDNMTQGITSESNTYPSNRAVQNALKLKQDNLYAGAAIDKNNLKNIDTISVRYDGTTITLEGLPTVSEGRLQTTNVKMNALQGKPMLTQIVPTDTKTTNYLINLDELNDKIRDALGNYIGLFDSAGEIPVTGVAKNDYAYVSAKDSSGEAYLSRYKCQQPSEGAPITWGVEYTIPLGTDLLFTSRQIAAINSGINQYLVVGSYNTSELGSEGLIPHILNMNNPHHVTADQLGLAPYANKSIISLFSEGLNPTVMNFAMGDQIITRTIGDGRYKKIQTAVSSPNVPASGTNTALSFIDTISQNTQGVITATKKTVQTVTTTQSGVMTPAMLNKLNGIQDGATKTRKSSINGNIIINNSETNVYTLPTATASRLGGVKIGTNVTVATDGTISIADASKTVKGVVKVGDNINVSSGTISVPIATTSALGVVKVGTGINVDANGVISSGLTFTSGNNGSFTVTPRGGTAQNVRVLPAITGVTDKYLYVNSSGALAWTTVSSGGGGTTYSAGTGLSLSGTTFNHASSITAGTLNNNTATVSDWSTAATYTVNISQAPYNATGHITSVTDRPYVIGQSNWDNNTTTSFPYVRNRPNIRLNGHTSSTGMNTTGTVIGRSTNVASGNYSLAEGAGTTASGIGSHAEGINTTASGSYSHAEGGIDATGVKVIASGYASHAEGFNTLASGAYSHAEGGGSYNTSDPSKNKPTTASSTASHAEGDGTVSGGWASHTEGVETLITTGVASHAGAHAEGYHTKIDYGISGVSAGGIHVDGRYNNTTKASSTNLDIINMTGIGTSDTNRINGMALTTGGDLRIKGNVYVGCNADSTGGTIAGGAKHYGTCVLPASAAGTVTRTVTFDDGYKLNGTEHPVLDVVCTNASTAESEISCWGAVYKATANSGNTITFYLKSSTLFSITVQVLV